MDEVMGSSASGPMWLRQTTRPRAGLVGDGAQASPSMGSGIEARRRTGLADRRGARASRRRTPPATGPAPGRRGRTACRATGPTARMTAVPGGKSGAARHRRGPRSPARPRAATWSTSAGAGPAPRQAWPHRRTPAAPARIMAGRRRGRPAPGARGCPGGGPPARRRARAWSRKPTQPPDEADRVRPTVDDVAGDDERGPAVAPSTRRSRPSGRLVPGVAVDGRRLAVEVGRRPHGERIRDHDRVARTAVRASTVWPRLPDGGARPTRRSALPSRGRRRCCSRSAPRSRACRGSGTRGSGSTSGPSRSSAWGR